MDLQRTTALRQAVAAVLMLALMMAGIGRGRADAPEASPSAVTIANLAVPICHAGRGAGSVPTVPGSPSGHDCCDLCALSAPIILPRLPVLSVMAAVIGREPPPLRLAASPPPRRVHDPRQAQGPPRV